MNIPSWSDLDLDIHYETKSDSNFAKVAYYFYLNASK